jgi:Zn-dependent peptidase ImmA (M78 family)
MMGIATLDRPRWDYARRRANELTTEYSFPPIPVVDIAEKTGVSVAFSDFGKHSATVAGFCDFGAKLIMVNDNDSFGRKRFTIAHELGHWVLHREYFLKEPSEYAVFPRFQSGMTNAFEKEANIFAAELLVPPRLLEPVKGATITQLAEIFGVSREMMEHRLKNA